MTPLDVQIAGDHYKKHRIQPVEFIHANNIPFIEANCIKYLVRWRDKGGVKDLEKAKHYIELLIELETRKAKQSEQAALTDYDASMPVQFVSWGQ